MLTDTSVRHAPPAASAPADFHTLQIGTGWLPEDMGGLQRVYYELMHALPQTGVSVSGLVVGSEQVRQTSGGRVRAPAVQSAALPMRLLALRRAVQQSMRAEDVDLVVSHFALNAFPALGAIGQTPHVVHFQGPWAQESAAEGDGRLSVLAKRMVEQAVYRRAARFIVLSKAFGDILHADYGVPRERIATVPCGVRVDQFAIETRPAAARQQLGWPADRPIVLCVRRLVRRMGIENLVAAMRQVVRRVPEVLLLIAGKGAMYDEINQMIEDTGLEDHVRLLGFVPEGDLPLAYRAADLTVVPTIALEGMGCVTLESMAGGTPVLVTPIGGLPEAVAPLSNDLVLPSAHPDALAEGLAQALTGALPLPSADECEAYARRRFDWPVIAEGVRDVYAQALR